MKEIKNMRKLREKYFLKPNGEFEVRMYDYDIHYIRNGKYETIDNTLVKIGNYYENKKNSFKSIFGKNHMLEIKKDNSYLIFDLEKENELNVIFSKENIIYKNILNNIDVNYYLNGNKIKEEIILNSNPNLNKIVFNLNTNLILKELDNKIIAKKDNKEIFIIEPPFMYDSNNAYNYNIFYKLVDNNKIELVLDEKWINSKGRIYPIIIDPTITNKTSDNNVYDTYIYEGDSLTDQSIEDVLKVGTDNNKIYRSLLKFNLPEIGTGSQVINATVDLTGYAKRFTDPYDVYAENYSYIDVHEMTCSWEEATAKWNDLNDKFNPRIETYGTYMPSVQIGNVLWEVYGSGFDITNLVKKWYSGHANNGIMLKSHLEKIENNDDVCKYYSKNNNISDEYNPKPLLVITYRNQNGLETYMSYKTQKFNEGSAYINNYNGNLTTAFNIIETVGGQMPANVALYYNTNDVVLNNNYGYGLGYKLNYHEMLEEENIDNNDYLLYHDEDGTIHYFYKDNNIYYDEDNLKLTIEKVNNNFIMLDNFGSKKEFTLIGDMWYLTKIIDTDNNANEIIYDNNKRIVKIIDANNGEINIMYNENNIIFSTQNKTITIKCNNCGQIEELIKDGKKTLFAYNDKNLLEKIQDINGLSIKYEYYDVIPYRMKKITEYGLNGTIGKSLEINYGFNVTSFVDNLCHKNTYTFNDYGNPVSITNLDINETLKDALGKNNFYLQDQEHKNQLLGTELLQKNSKNYFKNSSFEYNNYNFNHLYNASVVEENPRTGKKAIKMVGESTFRTFVEVEDNNYYTISGYFKGTGNAKFYLEIVDTKGLTEFLEYESFVLTDDYERHEITMFLGEGYYNNINLCVIADGRVCFVDDIQVEKGEVSNVYNLFDNPDFSDDLNGWLVNDEENYNGNEAEIITLDTGINALKIKHDPYDINTLSKTFDIKGKAGDVYFLSFWYKNLGLSGLGASFYPANALINWNFTNIPDDEGFDYTPIEEKLNFNENEWQYFSSTFSAEYDYDKVYFNLFMENNINETYVTNFSLHKGVTNLYYDYDEEGNITSVTDLDQNTTVFNYDKNNQLINMTTPLGSNLSYEYDNTVKDRILSAVSETGISNEIKYDNFGNPIITRIKATGDNNTQINGKYYIRLKGTEKYLEANYPGKALELKEDKCSNERFLIIKENDYYIIKSILIPSLYVGYENNKLILTKMKDKAKLTLEKNNNDSYYIRMYQTDKYLKNNMNFEEIDTQNPEFEFYFHNASSPYFIENAAEYTEDGRFIKSTTDTLFNKTEYTINTNNGLLEKTKDAKGNETKYEYNEEEQVTKVTKGNKKVEYQYNEQSMLSNIKSGTKEYNFTYNEFLKPVTVGIGENITLITNEYENNNGNLKKVTYGNGSVINYEYDEFDRIKELKKYGCDLEYKYDNYGNVKKIVDKNNIYNYEYDRAQRLVGYNFNDFKLKYDYDKEDNVINKKYYLKDIIKNKTFTYNKENALVESVLDDTKVNYSYDELGRIKSKCINDNYATKYNYVRKGYRTSLLLDSIENGNDKYSYKYDSLNNITHVYYNNELVNEYFYDIFNELIKEHDYKNNKTIEYTYDLEGNILIKKIYELKTDNLIKEDSYEYNNPNWEDQLTKFNNTNITYDEIGNPITIGNANLTWKNGRELRSYEDNDLIVKYDYNKDGIRTSKIVNGVETKYYLENTNIIFEETDNNMIYYLRDDDGDLIGLKYNEYLYYYQKNAQEDIIGLLDSNYNLIATYEYDSWGNVITIKDALGNTITDANNIAIINPYRYRSYYYDKETSLYYLNSRYYNPIWGRFINADGIIGELNGTYVFKNLYYYSLNNPITLRDSDGCWPKWAKNLSKIAVGVASAGLGVVAAVSAGCALGPTLMVAASTTLTIATISATTNVVKSVATSIIEKESPKEMRKKAIESAKDGFSNGVMVGGIVSGIGLANNLIGPSDGKTENKKYGIVDIGYGNSSSRTLINISDKKGKSIFRLDVDSENLFHLHYKTKKVGKTRHRKTIVDVILGVISGVF